MSTGPHFAILGLAKLKGQAELSKAAGHGLRERPVKNADPARAGLNLSNWVAGGDALVAEIETRTRPLMKRKDAVQAIEFMLTASPEWFAEHGGKGKHLDLTQAALRFAQDTFGKRNIVAAGLHLDETTPHVWLLITPITPAGKLSASHWTDGPKAIAALHDAWAEATKHLGLVRGVRGSPARHIPIRDYYAAVNGDPTAAASIEAEMRRRAVSAQRVEEGAKKRVAELEAEISVRTSDVAKRERLAAADRAHINLLLEALSPDQQYTVAKRVEAAAGTSTPTTAPERPTTRSTTPQPSIRKSR